ncbi:MAG: hypothetical protein GY846_03700 [Deltaproteobacteria bacterium]|nr:hypothetical protein [Deltaproteobacteria bacterium]
MKFFCQSCRQRPRPTHPEDTFSIVYNRATTESKVHYHVWDKNGNATDLYGEQTLSGNETWAASMRGLIAGSTDAVRTVLDDGGSYYRGFVTIDLVTADTTKNPTEAGYPFAVGATSNVLEGFIYYVRLAQGSSNSLPMLPINWVPATTQAKLVDLYQTGDEREEFDANAMTCAAHLASETAGHCPDDTEIARIDSRVYLDQTYSAKTRIVIFTWNTDVVGGPSLYCDTHACESDYDYKQYDPSGNLVTDTTVRLPSVVNVLSVSGTANGLVSIQNIPDTTAQYQVYAFSITNASPSSGANWDAILPSYIEP